MASRPKKDQPTDGWLRVTLLFEEGGKASVILPQPAQPLGERILVNSDQLREKVEKK